MIKVVLLVVAATTVLAYDFKDSSYNEVLMQDLFDFEDDDSIFRARRDVPAVVAASTPATTDDKCKKSRGPIKCCNDNTDYSFLEKHKEIKKQCITEIRGAKTEDPFVDMFKCEQINKTKEEFKCVAQCAAQKMNHADKDGNLIEDEVRRHIKNDVAIADWQKEKIDDIITNCFAEVKKPEVATVATAKVRRDTAEPTVAVAAADKKCNPASLKFGYCAWRELSKACPKEFQSDSPKCVKLREKFAKGENVSPLSFFKHHGFDDK